MSIFYVGPFDLAMQMGVERGGEEHEAAIQRILKAAKAEGKTAAIFCKFFFPSASLYYYCLYYYYIYIPSRISKVNFDSSGTSGEQAKARAEQGFDMISVIADVNVIGDGIVRELNAAKGEGAEGGNTSRVY